MIDKNMSITERGLNLVQLAEEKNTLLDCRSNCHVAKLTARLAFYPAETKRNLL